MLPLERTLMLPPFAKTGPVTGVEMVCVEGVQPAQAAPGAPTATSAASEAPASKIVRDGAAPDAAANLP